MQVLSKVNRMRSRILMAENEPKCRRTVTQLLQRSGFQVTAVDEGMEVIEAIQNGCQPDIIILSWELPFGEGEALLEWVQQEASLSIRVMVLTAGTVGATAQWESALPGVTWLQRPFCLHDLLEAVQTPLRGARAEWRWRKPQRNQLKSADGYDVFDTPTSAIEVVGSGSAD